MKTITMSIHNGPNSAVTTGKWNSEKGKELYTSIAYMENRLVLGQEGFLLFSKDAFRNWPRASGYNRCKYPHHIVVDGNMVVSIPGLRAAYARAKQQGIYAGRVKEHLDRHFLELGLAHEEEDKIVFEDTRLSSFSRIENNFDNIEMFIEATTTDNFKHANGEIVAMTREMATTQHLTNWWFTTEEFSGMTTDQFDYDILVNDEKLGHYVYGYQINGNIEGIIRLRADHNAISMLFVNPKMESRGIGQTLLRFIISNFGDKELKLNVFANNDRAIRIYRKYDFVVTHEKIVQPNEGDDNRFVGCVLYNMTKTSVDSPDGRLNYSPPLSPDKLPEHLRNDKVHLWRSMTGIELIHKEPGVDELLRIWDNWKLMTPAQKKISDKASLEFFKINNEEHFAALSAEYLGVQPVTESTDEHLIASDFTEKSHGSLKYEYRIGIDVKTGKLTAVQFKLEPDAIVSVGNDEAYKVAHILQSDKRLNAAKRIQKTIDNYRTQGNEKDAKDLELKLRETEEQAITGAKSKALDFVKSNIKKLGHIDYISSGSTVDKIFHKDGSSMNSVNILATLSSEVKAFVTYLEDEYDVEDFKVKSPRSYDPAASNNYTYSFTKLFANDQIRSIFVEYCKNHHLKGEEYRVGKLAGENKYRSTKLLWDSLWMYMKYTKSPVLRGTTDPYVINDNFKSYDGTNKPKRKRIAYTENAIGTEKEISEPDPPEEQLLELMDLIEYGWVNKHNEKCGAGDDDDESVFFRDYRLQSPLQLMRSGIGVNWDRVELQRDWFNKHDYPNAVIYLEIDDGANCPTHTFSIFKHPGESSEVFWFEHSWANMRGIHSYKNLSDCVNDVISKHVKFCNVTGPLIATLLRPHPPYGSNCQQYMEYARKSRCVDRNDLAYDDIFNENYTTLDWLGEFITEAIDTTDEQSTTVTEPDKESAPKQIDKAETPKNGVKRKELYIAFIEYAKRYNAKNTFGSVFDKDAFRVTYQFVPEEMRYFYRLANPLLCVLDDQLTFFSLTELRKINSKNPLIEKHLIFAADDKKDVVAFNVDDKAIYHVAEDTIGNAELVGKIADSFDNYLEQLAGVRLL